MPMQTCPATPISTTGAPAVSAADHQRAYQHVVRVIGDVDSALTDLLGLAYLLKENDDVWPLARVLRRVITEQGEQVTGLLAMLKLLEIRATPEALAEHGTVREDRGPLAPVAAFERDAIAATLAATEIRRQRVAARRGIEVQR